MLGNIQWNANDEKQSLGSFINFMLVGTSCEPMVCIILIILVP